MIPLDPPFRAATPDDAAALTDLVHFASEGLALYVWTRIAGPAGDAWAVGRQRASRETGSFSYRNAVLVEQPAGRVAAALIGYALPDGPSPSPTPCRPCSCRCRNWRTWCPAPGTSTCLPPIPTARQGPWPCAARHRRPALPLRRAGPVSASSSPTPTPPRGGSTSAAVTGKRRGARRSRRIGSRRHRVGADGEAIVNRDRTPHPSRCTRRQPELPGTVRRKGQPRRCDGSGPLSPVVIWTHDRHPHQDHHLQAPGDRRGAGCPIAGADRGGGPQGPTRAALRQGPGGQDRGRPVRADRRDQEGEPLQGPDPRGFRSTRACQSLRGRRRGLPLRADGRPLVPGLARASARGARRHLAARHPQGFHARPLPGRPVAGLGRRLHPDHHGGRRRRDGRHARRLRQGLGHGCHRRGPRRARARPRPDARLPADRHQQPRPEDLQHHAGDHRDAGPARAEEPHRHRRKRHQHARRPAAAGEGGRARLPGRRKPDAPARRRRRHAGAARHP